MKIAFCDLPQEISSSVEEVVSKNSNVKYKISNISKEEFVSKNVKKIAKKNDILFANDGKIAELIEEYAKDIPAVYEMLQKGCETAQAKAAQTLSEVKKAMRIDYFNT